MTDSMFFEHYLVWIVIEHNSVIMSMESVAKFCICSKNCGVSMVERAFWAYSWHTTDRAIEVIEHSMNLFILHACRGVKSCSSLSVEWSDKHRSGGVEPLNMTGTVADLL